MSEVRFIGLKEVRFQGDALTMVRLGNDQVWPTPPTGYTITFANHAGAFSGDGVLDRPTPAKVTRFGKTFTIPKSQFDVVLHGYDQATPTLTFPLGFSILQIGDQVECLFYHEYFPYASTRLIKFTVT